MIKSELGWLMCWADVARLESEVLTTRHELESTVWWYDGYNGRFGIYGELQRLLQTSAPPPSAVSKVQLSVYTWGGLHRSHKSVCVQVHMYSHMHICAGVWSEGLLVWPTWLEPNRSNMKGKVPGGKSLSALFPMWDERMFSGPSGIQVPSERFKVVC